MSRCIVNVATGAYLEGQDRLRAAIAGEVTFMAWADMMPPGSPSHLDIPFAFKAYALAAAADAGWTTLIWADSSILPIRPLDSLFEKIESDGAWIMNNGFANAEWTAPSAYQFLGVTPEENENIPHVVAGVFGVNLLTDVGRKVLDGYLALAKTRAFCGPVRLMTGTRGSRGDMRVSGHRHDQTALSVVAQRNGVKLTDPPEFFAYARTRPDKSFYVEDQDPRTVLVAY